MKLSGLVKIRLNASCNKFWIGTSYHFHFIFGIIETRYFYHHCFATLLQDVPLVWPKETSRDLNLMGHVNFLSVLMMLIYWSKAYIL
jgi:hypothetical protein